MKFLGSLKNKPSGVGTCVSAFAVVAEMAAVRAAALAVGRAGPVQIPKAKARRRAVRAGRKAGNRYGPKRASPRLNWGA